MLHYIRIDNRDNECITGDIENVRRVVWPKGAGRQESDLSL